MMWLADYYIETAGTDGIGFFQIGGGIAGDFPGVLISPFGLVPPDVLGIPVGLGIDDDIVEPQIPATIHDADGYFAAVGDEHLSFHTVPLAYGCLENLLICPITASQ